MEKATMPVGCSRPLGRRLLLFSLPFQGHINPIFQLATLLFQRGFSITVIHTLYNAPDPSSHPHFRFIPIDEGLGKEILDSEDILVKTIAIREACRAPFRDCLARLLEEATQKGEDPVACLLVDAMLNTITDVAEDLGVRWVAVRTSSAAYLRLFCVYPGLWEKGYYPIQENRLEELVPEAPPYRVKDLTRFSCSSDESMYQIVVGAMEAIRTSAALVLNTFEELETADLAVLRRDLPCPVLTVGPLHKFSQNASSSLLQQDRGCMAWLDRHPAGSVVYVSFGSLACVEKEELAEVAWGLAGSGQPFLWVVREGSVRGEAAAVELPAGFVEETRGRGMVVAWAPQLEVLAHPAVGAFWTHCGWNSIVESICEGVPMLCRAAFGDQTGNARYVSHVWKVGLVLEGVLQREQVERAVRTLLVDHVHGPSDQRFLLHPHPARHQMDHPPPCCDRQTPRSPVAAYSEDRVPPFPANSLPFSFRFGHHVFFFPLFFLVLYYLMLRWREKIRAGAPLHLLTFLDVAAIVALAFSGLHIIRFFELDLFQPAVCPRSSDDNEGDDPTASSDSRCVPLHCGLAAPSVSKMSFPSLTPADPLLGSAEDEEIVQAVLEGTIPSYSLESRLGDCTRAAGVRKEALRRATGKSLDGLPLGGFDYESILGQCCEMPVGYVTLPVGIAGPMLLDGKQYYVPMATTEGCLVASTNRGLKAIRDSGGATSVVLRDGMTRAPAVRFGSAKRAAELRMYLEDPLNFNTLSAVFNKSSRFARLQSIQCAMAGKNLYMRFSCSTGDAMGMNMVSKGVQNVLDFLGNDFPDMDVISISGNFCSDKKPAAVNWIEGRGKSVVCEAVIEEKVVKKVLKTTVPALVELNVLKNLAGSAVAGALGGFNAHAANIVSALYIATGQDPAQNVESSHCITMMEAVNGGKDLHISVTMPSIEVGTVGGGTSLSAQAALLDLLGVKGPNKGCPGANARLLATIVAGAVLGGELSLMSALAAGQLVKSHMKYNRSSKDVAALTASS